MEVNHNYILQFCFIVYGLTESSGAVVTTAKTQPSPPFSVGIPAPGIQVKVTYKFNNLHTLF